MSVEDFEIVAAQLDFVGVDAYDCAPLDVGRVVVGYRVT